MILLYTSILPVSQRQTQQMMSSEIRSRIEYLIQTHNILMLTLHPKFMKNPASSTILIRFNGDAS